MDKKKYKLCNWHLKEQSTVYEQRDKSVPRKHHADHRGNWGTTKTRSMHRVVYSFNVAFHYSTCIIVLWHILLYYDLGKRNKHQTPDIEPMLI